MAKDEPTEVKDVKDAKVEKQEAEETTADEVLRDEYIKSTVKAESNYEFHQKGDPVSRVASRGLDQVNRVSAEGAKEKQDAPDAKVNTKIGNSTLEYNPKEKSYVLIDDQGKSKPVGDDDKIGPNGETLKDLKEKGVKSEDVKEGGTDAKQITYPDGAVRTVLDPAKVAVGGLSEKTVYPPGHPDGLKSEQIFKGNDKEPGRAERDFTNRSEVIFESGKVLKVTTIKDAAAGSPATVTDYRNNGGPNGEAQLAVFKDDPHGRDKASVFGKDGKVEKYVYSFKDGHSETLVPRPDGTPAPSEMQFPASEGDPRGKTNLTYKADRVETTFENAVNIGGVAIKGVDSLADGTSVFKDAQGRAVQLNPEQQAAAAALMEKAMHQLTTPRGDRINYMADGSRISEFNVPNPPQPGTELIRKEFPFARNGALVESKLVPGQDGVDRVVVDTNGQKHYFRGNERVTDQQGPGQSDYYVPTGGTDVEITFGRDDYAGRMFYNSESGIPQRMRIGNRDYTMSYGNDGQLNRMSIQGPNGRIDFERGRDGRMMCRNVEGAYKPDANGICKLEGLPLRVGRDGQLIGELTLNKKGDLRYKTGDGPERHEYVRRADGTMEHFDIGKWKRTSYGPNGQATKEAFWDGYEWRQGQISADGKRIDFAKEEGKPTYVMRQAAEGPPPVDRTQHGYDMGRTVDADWTSRMQVEKLQGPPEKTTTRFFNGAEYREGTATRTADGGTQVTFNEPGRGMPRETLYGKDGSQYSKFADGTEMIKDRNGYVTAIKGPRGNYKFDRDPDGDITRVRQFDEQGQLIDTMLRRGGERNSGMENFFARYSVSGIRAPGERPPRDLAKPTDFNTFVNSRGESVRVNINVTADGTLRREYPGADGSPYITYDRIEADNYREQNGRSIIERAGGVTEIVDNTKNPPEQIVNFKRNGIDHSLSSANGPILVDERGFVTQQSKDAKQITVHTADGVIANLAVNEQTKVPAYTTVKVPVGQGQYRTLTVGQENVTAVQVMNDGKVLATAGESKFVFNPKTNTVSEQKPNEQFLRESNVATGEFKGINDVNGLPIWTVGKDGITSESGVTFKTENWDLKSLSINTNGDLKLQSKDGKEQALLRANGSSYETKEGKGIFTFPDRSRAVLNSSGGFESLHVGDKTLEPTMSTDGLITGMKMKPGDQVLKPIPASAAYKFDRETGKIATDYSDNNGVKTRTVWNPTTNTYSVERKWTGSTNQDNIMSVTMNAEGEVVKFKLPDGSTKEAKPKELVVADIKKGSPNVQISYQNGTLSVKLGEATTGTFNADGSYNWAYKSGEKQFTNSFDRMNQLQVANAEAAAISDLIDKKVTAGDKNAISGFANLVVDKVSATSDPEKSLTSWIKSLNDGPLAKLSPAATTEAQIGRDGSVVITVKRNGKSYTHTVAPRA
ncbi:MAG: hypothetical protein K2X77_27480 [Candidatus Obscuribacterales bacterium]|nr:hypothetical protein [Candidatus Obscuribacterales bacterium]